MGHKDPGNRTGYPGALNHGLFWWICEDPVCYCASVLQPRVLVSDDLEGNQCALEYPELSPNPINRDPQVI